MSQEPVWPTRPGRIRHMESSSLSLRLATESVAALTIEQVAREGARRALQAALEREVREYLDAHRHWLDQRGHRLVVGNGRKKRRAIVTGLGPLEVEPPRVDDRRVDERGERRRFVSKILPPYLRKTKVIEEMIPWLYLKGISTNDMPEALSHLGFDGSGFSSTNVVRMKGLWSDEYEIWRRRDLSSKKYVYWWVDGLHLGVRLSDERPCLLVIMGVTKEGTKELIAVHDGPAESESAWTEVLLDLKSRGLAAGPKLATGDGALGFWRAMSKLYPSTRQQRCWVHKTRNILNKLPRSDREAAKKRIHDIWMAGTKEQALRAMNLFVEMYQKKQPNAVECLLKDREELMSFYDFPAEHWQHVRTTNAIESTFATVQLRTYKTRGFGSRDAAVTMAWKLAEQAQKGWRRLKGSELIDDVIIGIEFVDGIRKAA